MAEKKVGLLGATSMVGYALQSALTCAGYKVTAFSRLPVTEAASEGVEWQQLPPAQPFSPPTSDFICTVWICAAPIWVLPDYFQFLEACGVRRVVAVSSTSRYTKTESSDNYEQETVRRLIAGEEALQSWAEAKGIEWVILRPTLIYGYGRDKNISEMARVIKRLGFFPLFGDASGLRQPIHADDVAQACVASLEASLAVNRAFAVSGGETLLYRDMVCRVFAALGRKPRLLKVPLTAFRCALVLLHALPRYRHWSFAMAERMNQDLVFDNSEAANVLGFVPRRFVLTPEDLPR